MKEKNYFFKLFNGEISLGITFWFWFLFTNLALHSLIYFYSISIYSFNAYSLEISISIYIIAALYALFTTFSLYKSAYNYEGFKAYKYLSYLISFLAMFLISQNIAKKAFILFYDERDLIKKEIETLSAQVPYKINETTTLLEASMKNNNVSYSYKLEDFTKDRLYGINLLLFKDEIIQSNCYNENVLNLVNKDIVLNFDYINKFDKKFISVKIDKQTCKNLTRDLEILRKILAQEKLQSFSF